MSNHQRRVIARDLTEWSKSLCCDEKRFIVTSGGGPGIMEAANRGASEAAGISIGLGISLPMETSNNKHITRELDFEFHYFFMRKFWFVYLAKAVIVFPGGFGTMDELFELLTLVQTEKSKKKMPIVLYGERFWDDVLNLEALERFCDFLDATEAHLSDIINNACQTIRRPAQYYRHLIEKELAPHEAPADHRRCLALHEACFGAAAALAAPASKQLLAPLAAPPQRSQGELSQGVPQGGRLVGAPADGAGSAAPAAAVPSALWSQLPVWGAPADGGEAGEAGEAGGEEAAALFPAGAHDVNGQQLDLRTTNSWLLRLGQVRTGEVAEARSRRRAGGASRVCTRRPGVGIGARNQHPRALHPQQPAPRAVAALARRRAAGRQRVCDGGQILPVQDGQPPAHQHGQGGAQHDDANLRRGARRERRLHELDRHRLDQRREPAAACGAHGREAPLPDAARRG